MMMNYITVLLFSNRFCTPQPDLCETPRSNSRNPIMGCSRVGFAVVSPHATLVLGSLLHHYSAQAAVLVALTEACKLTEALRPQVKQKKSLRDHVEVNREHNLLTHAHDLQSVGTINKTCNVFGNCAHDDTGNRGYNLLKC